VIASKPIVSQLREMAEQLKPFIDDIVAGSKVWDGNAYTITQPQTGDPFARVWWSVLETVADLLELDDRSLDHHHLEYIRSRFLSGMGSFADFQLDEQQWGESAFTANRRLNIMRDELSKLVNKGL